MDGAIGSTRQITATPPEDCALVTGNGVQQCQWESGEEVTAIFLNGRSLRTRHVFEDVEGDRARLRADPVEAFSAWLSMSEDAYRARSPEAWEVEALTTGLLPPDDLPAGLQACRRSRVESLTPEPAALTMIEYVCGRYDPRLDLVTLIDLEVFGSLRLRLDEGR